MVSKKKMFEYFFENLPFMSSWQPIKLGDLRQKSYDDYSINIPVFVAHLSREAHKGSLWYTHVPAFVVAVVVVVVVNNFK